MPRMPSVSPSLPTSSELEILQVIWRRGPSTVREVYRTLSAEREVGYSTVLKFMQIMTDKGTLLRDESVRPQIYRAARPQRQTQQGIVRDLVARAFGGSSAGLVMQALSDKKASADERRQIRELLDALDGKPERKKS
jgi:BlaI family penicillinase repressor